MTKKENLSYKKELESLTRKKQIAQIKRAERKLKLDILKMYLPHFNFKFNKFIVIFCIAAIISYTIAAILLQKYTMIELSPTLTGIKCFDLKCNNTDINNDKLDIIESKNENVDIDNDAVG